MKKVQMVQFLTQTEQFISIQTVILTVSITNTTLTASVKNSLLMITMSRFNVYQTPVETLGPLRLLLLHGQQRPFRQKLKRVKCTLKSHVRSLTSFKSMMNFSHIPTIWLLILIPLCIKKLQKQRKSLLLKIGAMKTIYPIGLVLAG